MPAYTDVPERAGGRAPLGQSLLQRLRRTGDDATTYECVSVTCGGPDACVHRWIGADAVDLDAVVEWRTYDAAPPPAFGAHARLDEARALVERLLALRCAPATLARCGASAAVLGALGFTLHDLVVGARYDVESVLDALVGDDTRALAALGFRPALWLDRRHFPVIAFTDGGALRLRAAALRDYALRYTDLVDVLHLRQEELVVLGYGDATVLRALGMSNVHVARACAELDRVGRGAHWYWRAFGWSRSLASSTHVVEVTDATTRRGAEAFARVYAEQMRAAVVKVP